MNNMMGKLLAILLMSILLLSGCSNDNDKPEERVFEGYEKSIDKARDLENVIKDSDQRRQAID